MGDEDPDMDDCAKIQVLTVMGTRPEAIKMAPVVAELQRRTGASPRSSRASWSPPNTASSWPRCSTCSTSRPIIDLDVMRPNQSPTDVLAAVLTRIQPILAAFRPHWVLVQGDTTTVLAAALAAAYAGIAVGHVEAGLRTYDRRNPFPEETNRVLVDHLSDLCFAPTTVARDALLAEGIPPARVHVTGNTVIDALYHIVEQARLAPPP